MLLVLNPKPKSAFLLRVLREKADLRYTHVTNITHWGTQRMHSWKLPSLAEPETVSF